MQMLPVAIITTAMALLKNGSFAECVLRDISGACVDTKQKQLAMSVVTGEDLHTASLCKPVKSAANEIARLVILCARIF